MSPLNRVRLALLALLLVYVLPADGCVLPSTQPATAAVYVYEKDQGEPSADVMAALDRLNRERGIKATKFEQDIRDGDNEVPDQYQVPLAAAKEAGLPALVVLAGNEVLRVVSGPTGQQVWEAVQ